MKRPYMIILFGPTAVGKTAVAERLAEYVPVEIINMDVGQLYTPLSIGTAKPDWRHSSVKHHMFDILDEPINYTVMEYREHVLVLLNEIWERGSLPILVGGSGFYARSLLFPPQTCNPLRLGKNVYQEEGAATGDLWQQLHAIDPERAKALHHHDTFRLERALEIWHTTGRKPSSLGTHYAPPADYFLLHLTRDRADLHERINERVMHMMQAGWLEEVKALQSTPWEPFLYEKKLIGYNELLHFLAYDDQDLAAVIARIQQRTRAYAKRQGTFWRMLQKQIELMCAQEKSDKKAVVRSVNLTSLDFGLYIKDLSKLILQETE